jgi:hypothetical protein
VPRPLTLHANRGTAERRDQEPDNVRGTHSELSRRDVNGNRIVIRCVLVLHSRRGHVSVHRGQTLELFEPVGDYVDLDV